jgi:hypothetical protein
MDTSLSIFTDENSEKSILSHAIYKPVRLPNLNASYEDVGTFGHVLVTILFTGLISQYSTVTWMCRHQHTTIQFCNEVPNILNNPKFHVIPSPVLSLNPNAGHHLTVIGLTSETIASR